MRKIQTFLSGIAFVALFLGGSIVDNVAALIIVLMVAVAAIGAIGLIEWIDDYLPERKVTR